MRLASGSIYILLGLLLLAPPLAITAWVSRQWVVGFDVPFRNGLVILTFLGLGIVATGCAQALRHRRKQRQ